VRILQVSSACVCVDASGLARGADAGRCCCRTPAQHDSVERRCRLPRAATPPQQLSSHAPVSVDVCLSLAPDAGPAGLVCGGVDGGRRRGWRRGAAGPAAHRRHGGEAAAGGVRLLMSLACSTPLACIVPVITASCLLSRRRVLSGQLHGGTGVHGAWSGAASQLLRRGFA
jgi:hypothetical protein